MHGLTLIEMHNKRRQKITKIGGLKIHFIENFK